VAETLEGYRRATGCLSDVSFDTISGAGSNGAGSSGASSGGTLNGDASKGLLEIADERLREKEFGVLDRLTRAGIESRFPDQAEARTRIGKFYHRPPGGESWCDVVLRLRSVIETITREYRRERVLVVSHQVIVNCFRYLLERLDERRILEIDREADVPNCSVTSYRFDRTRGRQGKLVLDLVNFVAPLEAAHAPITVEKDVPVAAKP